MHTHFLCKDCWEKVASTNCECPFCMEDLRTWLLQECSEKLTNQQVQRFLVSVMCMQGGSQPVLDDDAMFDISVCCMHDMEPRCDQAGPG